MIEGIQQAQQQMKLSVEERQENEKTISILKETLADTKETLAEA